MPLFFFHAPRADNALAVRVVPCYAIKAKSKRRFLMTVCIGMIDHKTKHVWMAADSQSSGDSEKMFLANDCPLERKIFPLRGIDGVRVAYAGYVVDGQIVAAMGAFSKSGGIVGDIDEEFVAGRIAPAVFSALRERRRTSIRDGIESLQSQFVIATASRAWVLWQDGSVTKIRDSWAIGSGEEKALGALSAAAKGGMGPRDALVCAVKAASETGLYCGGDILVVDATDGTEEIVRQG
jgi:ATP-dependent protease HslVU (ClpYQ) peptidase subunit